MNDKMSPKEWEHSLAESKDDKMTREKRALLPVGSKDDSMMREAWRFPLDESKKESSLAAVHEAAEKKQIRRYPSLWENLWNQFRFQPWKCRAGQGLVLLSAMLLILYLNRKNVEGAPSVMICSVFLVFAGNIGLSGVARLFSWHMAELEQTLYLNLKQMVCIRMLEAGLVDLAVLTLLTGFTGRLSSVGTGAWLLYMLVPFLWSDVLYLHMLTAFRNVLSGYRQLSAGLVCGLLAFFPAFLENAYEAVYLPVWGAFLAAGVLLLAAEIYGILGKIEGGDSLCLN